MYRAPYLANNFLILVSSFWVDTNRSSLKSFPIQSKFWKKNKYAKYLKISWEGVNCENALNFEGLCEFPDVYGKTRPDHKIPQQVINLIIMKHASAASSLPGTKLSKLTDDQDNRVWRICFQFTGIFVISKSESEARHRR